MKTKFLILTACLSATTGFAADFGRLEGRVDGKAALNPSGGAVYVAFVGSPSMTDAVRRDLVRTGYSIAMNKADGKQILTLRGQVTVRSSNGKTSQDDLAVIAEGERMAAPVPKKEDPAPAQIPEGHYTVGQEGKPVTKDGISVLAGYPVAPDLGDQGRSYARRLAGKGVGNEPLACGNEKCKQQMLSQQVTIDVEVSTGGKVEKGRSVASMQSDAVNVDILTARAMIMAMSMIKGAK
jgi:uncharacterized Zn-binding protein involved in type VI secretion